jgi:prevent-host-death family protein
MSINILEAKNRLSELVKAAMDGEEIIIANRGKPVARLVCMEPPPPAPPAGIAAWLAANPLPAHARRSADVIDAAIGAERAGWE